MSAFPGRIRYISADEPVTSAVANRATLVLDQRTQYLRDALATLESRSLLVLEDAPLAETALPGHAVYWNAQAQRFESAIVAIAYNTATGRVTTTENSDVVGMVLRKTHATQGTIALHGLAKFPSLTNAIDGPVVPGRYYLSGAAPGKLRRQGTVATVPVCYVFGTLSACSQEILVYVNPQPRDFLDDHVHYQIELVATPAGQHTPPAAGGVHVISNPDPSKPGWLPADHAVFGNTAPPGAKFGYNIAAHATLKQLWPPVPVEACVLEVYRQSVHAPAGNDTVFVAGRVLPEYVKIDQFGIWWMTDCYDQVPWPTTYDSSQSPPPPQSGCPVVPSMRLVLSYAKMTFATDKTAVTSLRPRPGSPLRFVDADGNPAVAGALWASLEAITNVAAQEHYGGQVLKTVDPSLNFRQGWVCEGVVAGSSHVTLQSTHQRRLVPGDATSPLVHQGIVTVTFDMTPGERELAPQIIRLGDALERFYRGLLYVGLPPGRESSVRLLFFVPPAGLPDNPVMRLRMLLLPTLSGTFPALTASYMQLPRPTTAAVPIPAQDTALAIQTAVQVTANALVEVASATFPVTPGDTVAISITRSADAAPLYAGDVGLVRLAGIITAGS